MSICKPLIILRRGRVVYLVSEQLGKSSRWIGDVIIQSHPAGASLATVARRRRPCHLIVFQQSSHHVLIDQLSQPFKSIHVFYAAEYRPNFVDGRAPATTPSVVEGRRPGTVTRWGQLDGRRWDSDGQRLSDADHDNEDD